MAGNLFVLPRQVPIDGGVVSPGAKLTFTATGTTTPQNTYTDIDLTVPSSNPVIADAFGEFAKIYLDPTLPDYRVKLTDTNDVLIYQDDDVPASQSGQSLTVNSTAPFIDFIESDASNDNSSWRIQVNSEQLTLQVANDALAAFTDILTVDRTLNVVDTIDLLPATLNHNGLDLSVETGTFTATYTGFTTSPSVLWRYTKAGNLVVMVPNAQLNATSNATGMDSGATDIPTSIRPLSAQSSAFIIKDNNVRAMGKINVTGGGQFQHGADLDNGVFTASGTKGFPGTQVVTYLLN